MISTRTSSIPFGCRLAWALVLAVGLTGIELHAQEGADTLPLVPESAPDAIIGLSAGWVQTGARNDFPSLLVGTSQVGSGVIPADYAEKGSGYIVELQGLIYFNDQIGLTLGFASLRSAAKYRGDTALLPTTLELQEAQFHVGGHVDVVGNFRRDDAGFRSVYIEGGMEFGIGIMANRVESSGVEDTISTAVREAAIGSFSGGDPFRNRVALRVGVGAIIDLSGNMYGQGLSLITETGYSLGLNPVFSSDVVQNNDFKTNHLIVQIGLGYRF